MPDVWFDTLSRRELGSLLPRAQRLMMRSIHVRPPQFGRRHASSHTLPLRVRPAMTLLTAVVLVLLGILGCAARGIPLTLSFHPSIQDYVYVNDKVMHFFGFMLASGLFYLIWDVDDSARRIWIWRHAVLGLAFVTCFVVGAIGSEFVQGALPFKEFQWGDIVANMLGSGLGLYGAYYIERYHRSRRELQQLYEPLDFDDYGALPDDDYDNDADAHAYANANAHANANVPKSSLTNVWDDRMDDAHLHTAQSSTHSLFRIGEDD